MDAIKDFVWLLQLDVTKRFFVSSVLFSKICQIKNRKLEVKNYMIVVIHTCGGSRPGCFEMVLKWAPTSDSFEGIHIAFGVKSNSRNLQPGKREKKKVSYLALLSFQLKQIMERKSNKEEEHSLCHELKTKTIGIYPKNWVIQEKMIGDWLGSNDSSTSSDLNESRRRTCGSCQRSMVGILLRQRLFGVQIELSYLMNGNVHLLWIRMKKQTEYVILCRRAKDVSL